MMRDDFPWGTLIMVAAACAVIFFIFASGAGGGTSVNNSHHNTTKVLSDIKVASDNQVNLFSKVTNCNAEGACIVTTNSTNTTDVRGDRNTITQSDGTVACQSKDNPNTYSPFYCQEGQ
jgi:hypothetical protein